MSEPWFDPNFFGTWCAAIGGGGLGTLGGVWGAFAGWLVPQGKEKPFVYGFGWLFLAIGVVSLVFGLVALSAGQPYAIWYPPTLVGAVLVPMLAVMLPMLRLRYRQAEERKMQAEDFRRG